MRVELIILQILKSKIPELESASDAFMNGISIYAADNNLSTFCSEDTSKTRFVLELFLNPILKMPAKTIIPYFENYQLIKDFNIISNNIYELALHRVQSHEKIDITEINAMENKANNCIAKICMNDSLKKLLDIDISDLILDLDYIRGKSTHYSMRISRTTTLF